MATPTDVHYTRGSAGPIAGGRSVLSSRATGIGAAGAALMLVAALAGGAAGAGQASGNTAHAVLLNTAAVAVAQGVGSLNTNGGVLIAADRLVDWTLAGVEGGIPDRMTVASTPVAYGNDTDKTSVVQAAISAAPPNTVVLLGPGITQLGSITHASNVTLRGTLDFYPVAGNVTIVGAGASLTLGNKPAGLDLPTGAVLWTRSHSKPGAWIKGTVTGQTSNTVTLNVTASNGSGTYNDWIVCVTVIVPIGGDGTGSCINLGTGGVSLGANIASSTKVLTAGATRDSTTLTHNGTGPGLSIGKYAVITSINDSEVALWGATNTSPGATWTDGWSSITGYTAGSRARGQIVKITGGIAGNNFNVFPPLYRNYTDTPWATIFDSAIESAGVENMYFLCIPGGSNYISNISMFRAANCWVKGCVSDFTENDHVRMEFSYRCEVRRCWTEDKFQTADSNSNYLGMITAVRKSSLIRIEDNIVKRAKDGIMLNWGAAGCVVSYNYCLGGYNAAAPNFLVKGITMNHGAHPQFNLADGNVVTHKGTADSTWGTSSDGLFHRCAFFGYDERLGPNNQRDVDATNYSMFQSNFGVDLWEGQIRYGAINCQLGHPTNWPARGALRKPTFPTGWGYDDPPIAIGLGKGGDDLRNRILADPAPTFIDHLNFDYASGTRRLDPGISVTTSPDSFCYASKPDWWDDTVPWPPIDGGNPLGLAATNPARKRYEARASMGKLYTYLPTGDVQLFMHFEAGTDGALLTPTLLNSCMQGTNSTGWETIQSIFGGMPAGATNLFTTSAAAHPVDKIITVNGAAAAFVGGQRGMRCTMGTDGFLQKTGITQAPNGAALACHFRWNGSGINSSPRDLIALRPDYTGGYQVLQAVDGPNRDLHAHWQPYNAPDDGVDRATNVPTPLNTWRWLRMKAARGGQYFTIEVYDPTTAPYTLIGTTRGFVSTGTTGTTTIWLGAIQYTAGAGQSVDFANVEINFNGTLPTIPRAGA